MNNYEDDVKLDGSLAEFNISTIGKKTNESFSGDFTVKCFMSPLDVIKADKLYRELLGEISPHLASDETQNLCFALSQLKYRVVKSPAGWKNTEIDGGHLDSNIVIEVLNRAIQGQEKFQKRSKERLEKLQNKLTTEIKEGKIKEDDPMSEEKE